MRTPSDQKSTALSWPCTRRQPISTVTRRQLVVMRRRRNTKYGAEGDFKGEWMELQLYLVQDYFWSHIFGGAAEGPRLTPGVDVLWESKVDHLDVAGLVQQQVLRLEISVDDSSVVEVLKCAHLEFCNEIVICISDFITPDMDIKISPHRQCKNELWCRRTSLKVKIMKLFIDEINHRIGRKRNVRSRVDTKLKRLHSSFKFVRSCHRRVDTK